MSYKKVKLKEVLIHRKGSILIDNDKDYKLCRVQLHRKGVLLRQIQKGSEIRTKKQQLCKTGDFIVAEMDAKLGGYGLIPEELDGAIVSSHYYLFETNEEKISRDFLQVLSQTDAIQKQIKAKGSTNYSSIRPHEVLEFEIYLPPLNEQMNIVKMYKSFCEQQTIFQTELKTQANLLSKLRQAYLQEAVMGKLTEPSQDDAKILLADIKSQKAQLIKEGKLRKEKPLPPIKPEEIPFEIPDNWVWCRLGDLAYITSGSTPSSDSFVDNGIPYLKMYNLRNQKIDFDYKPQFIKEEVHNGQLKRCRAYSGDILMNIVGPPLGKIAIIPDSIPECNFNQAAVLIRPIFNVMNYYIYWFLNEMSQINDIDTKGVAGQDNISVTQAHSIKVALPPLSEQKAIVEKVEGLLANVSLLEEENKIQQNEVQRLMGAVLQEAFGGR